MGPLRPRLQQVASSAFARLAGAFVPLLRFLLGGSSESALVLAGRMGAAEGASAIHHHCRQNKLFDSEAVRWAQDVAAHGVYGGQPIAGAIFRRRSGLLRLSAMMMPAVMQ